MVTIREWFRNEWWRWVVYRDIPILFYREKTMKALIKIVGRSSGLSSSCLSFPITSGRAVLGFHSVYSP
jgi:hypothetical protein